jgi:AcrR family transcriptional regulator
MTIVEIAVETPVRDRLLLAGARLLEGGDGEVSTRAICETAGVQAPTLYHHFKSKQGLLDAVVSHGFRQFLSERPTEGRDDADPIAAVRDAWDTHVRFGLEHPTFYAHIYGAVQRATPCEVVGDVEALILQTLEPAARAGRLQISAAAAAAQILAASSGVVMHLLTSRQGVPDWGMSDRVRDAILDSITTDAVMSEQASPRGVPQAAITLAAMLSEQGFPDSFSSSEEAMFAEWLNRLSE